MPPTVMASPTIVFPPSEPLPTSRRAIALEHRRQNILTMKYRSSSSSLRDTSERQQRQLKTTARTDRTCSEKPRERTAITRQKLQSCSSYRLQSADIDSWLKESMPLPPDEDYAPPMPLMGLGIAMYEHNQDQESYEQAQVAPLNIGRGRTKDDRPKHQAQSTPRTLAQTVKQLRLTDYDEREYRDYRASDDARSSYYASSSSSELLNWPLVNT